MSLFPFQGMLEKKLIPYLQLSLLLLGLSGCKPSFFSSEEDVLYTTQDPSTNYPLQLGLAYLEAGNILSAKKNLFEAERKDPNAASIKSAIAYFLEHTGESEKAESYHLKALALDKKGGAVHNNYGRFLCQCNRYKEAEKHFLQAVQDIHYLNTASAYENAGLCAMRIFDTQKAIHYLKTALKHNSQLEKSRLALAQLLKH